MRHYESTLAQISDQIYKATSAAQAKQIFIDYVKSTGIKDKDKKKIEYDLSSMTSLYKIQYYFTNSLLRFEGLSVNSYAEEK